MPYFKNFFIFTLIAFFLEVSPQKTLASQVVIAYPLVESPKALYHQFLKVEDHLSELRNKKTSQQRTKELMKELAELLDISLPTPETVFPREERFLIDWSFPIEVSSEKAINLPPIDKLHPFFLQREAFLRVSTFHCLNAFSGEKKKKCLQEVFDMVSAFPFLESLNEWIPAIKRDATFKKLIFGLCFNINAEAYFAQVLANQEIVVLREPTSVHLTVEKIENHLQEALEIFLNAIKEYPSRSELNLNSNTKKIKLHSELENITNIVKCGVYKAILPISLAVYQLHEGLSFSHENHQKVMQLEKRLETFFVQLENLKPLDISDHYKKEIKKILRLFKAAQERYVLKLSAIRLDHQPFRVGKKIIKIKRDKVEEKIAEQDQLDFSLKTELISLSLRESSEALSEEDIHFKLAWVELDLFRGRHEGKSSDQVSKDFLKLWEKLKGGFEAYLTATAKKRNQEVDPDFYDFLITSIPLKAFSICLISFIQPITLATPSLRSQIISEMQAVYEACKRKGFLLGQDPEFGFDLFFFLFAYLKNLEGEPELLGESLAFFDEKSKEISQTLSEAKDQKVSEKREQECRMLQSYKEKLAKNMELVQALEQEKLEHQRRRKEKKKEKALKVGMHPETLSSPAEVEPEKFVSQEDRHLLNEWDRWEKLLKNAAGALREKSPVSSIPVAAHLPDPSLSWDLRAHEKVLKELLPPSWLQTYEQMTPGRWKLSRDRLIDFFKALGCTVESGKGSHLKIFWEGHLVQLLVSEEKLSVLTNERMILPKWEKKVPEYLRKQILKGLHSVLQKKAYLIEQASAALKK